MSSESSVDYPVATLVDDSDYALYAVAFSKERLIAAGGGSDGGLIGIPVHMYTVKDHQGNEGNASAQLTTDLDPPAKDPPSNGKGDKEEEKAAPPEK